MSGIRKDGMQILRNWIGRGMATDSTKFGKYSEYPINPKNNSDEAFMKGIIALIRGWEVNIGKTFVSLEKKPIGYAVKFRTEHGAN